MQILKFLDKFKTNVKILIFSWYLNTFTLKINSIKLVS